jgi:outer membrane protein TolC
MADTIEAFAQLQNYRLLQAEALLELNKRTLNLSYYLWSVDAEPHLLPPTYLPDTTKLLDKMLLPDSSQLIKQVTSTHPLLQAGEFKLQILQAEKRLKFQNLLPTLNIQANLLSKEYFQYEKLSSLYFQNNYKLGVGVKVPLLFRRERGEYKNIQLKIEETGLELADKTWEIQNKVRQYIIESVQLQQQLQTALEMKTAYTTLLRMEELRFAQGESSLFLINTRENKLLEMQQKIIELQVKYLKAGYAIQWASGEIR